MEMFSLDCANCGAPLTVASGARVVTCDHCGAKLAVREDSPPRESHDIRTADDSPAAPARRPIHTEVLEVVNTTAGAVQTGFAVVDRVTSMFFWAKVTVVVLAVLCVIGCCVVPGFVVYALFTNQATVDRTPGDEKPPSREFQEDVDPPADLAQAITYLDDFGHAHRVAAVRWLATEEIADDDKQRRQVVRALIGQLGNPPLLPQIKPVLKRWLAEEDRDALAAGIVQHINHPNAGVRTHAQETLTALEIEPGVAVRQCIDDLTSDQRRNSALQNLIKFEIQSDLHASVVAAVAPLVEDRAAAGQRDAILNVLAKCQPAGILALVQAMENNAYRREAAEHLKQAGPAAESHVLALLEDDNLFLRMAACEILGEVGTQRSIPALRRLLAESDRQSLARAAELAIGKIVAADRKPADEQTPTDTASQ